MATEARARELEDTVARLQLENRFLNQQVQMLMQRVRTAESDLAIARSASASPPSAVAAVATAAPLAAAARAVTPLGVAQQRQPSVFTTQQQVTQPGPDTHTNRFVPRAAVPLSHQSVVSSSQPLAGATSDATPASPMLPGGAAAYGPRAATATPMAVHTAVASMYQHDAASQQRRAAAAAVSLAPQTSHRSATLPTGHLSPAPASGMAASLGASQYGFAGDRRPWHHYAAAAGLDSGVVATPPPPQSVVSSNNIALPARPLPAQHGAAAPSLPAAAAASRHQTPQPLQGVRIGYTPASVAAAAAARTASVASTAGGVGLGRGLSISGVSGATSSAPRVVSPYRSGTVADTAPANPSLGAYPHQHQPQPHQQSARSFSPGRADARGFWNPSGVGSWVAPSAAASAVPRAEHTLLATADDSGPVWTQVGGGATLVSPQPGLFRPVSPARTSAAAPAAAGGGHVASPPRANTPSRPPLRALEPTTFQLGLSAGGEVVLHQALQAV